MLIIGGLPLKVKHLFIFRRNNDVIIIPKRVFTSEQHLNDLKNFVTRKLSEHKN